MSDRIDWIRIDPEYTGGDGPVFCEGYDPPRGWEYLYRQATNEESEARGHVS